MSSEIFTIRNLLYSITQCMCFIKITAAFKNDVIIHIPPLGDWVKFFSFQNEYKKSWIQWIKYVYLYIYTRHRYLCKPLFLIPKKWHLENKIFSPGNITQNNTILNFELKYIWTKLVNNINCETIFIIRWLVFKLFLYVMLNSIYCTS